MFREIPDVVQDISSAGNIFKAMTEYGGSKKSVKQYSDTYYRFYAREGQAV